MEGASCSLWFPGTWAKVQLGAQAQPAATSLLPGEDLEGQDEAWHWVPPPWPWHCPALDGPVLLYPAQELIPSPGVGLMHPQDPVEGLGLLPQGRRR